MTRRSCKASHMPHTWSLHFNLKGEPHRVLAVSKGIAAYIYVYSNGRLSSGQRAKHPQRSNEAEAKDGLRLSCALIQHLHMRCVSIDDMVEISAGSAHGEAFVGVQTIVRAWRSSGAHSHKCFCRLGTCIRKLQHVRYISDSCHVVNVA